MSKDVSDAVIKVLDSIVKTQNESTPPQPEASSEEQLEQSTRKQNKIKRLTNKIDVRGKPKSGRFWKSKKERFSAINMTKGIKQDFKKKTALRLELKRTKELSKQLQEQLKEKEINRKERRRENIKRAEENKRKAEIVQVITNTSKLRRMKKKQLRFIEKRDTNKASNIKT